MMKPFYKDSLIIITFVAGFILSFVIPSIKYSGKGEVAGYKGCAWILMGILFTVAATIAVYKIL